MAVLRQILHEIDDKISPSDLDLMIEEIDADGSGTVDFEGRFFCFCFTLEKFYYPHFHLYNSLSLSLICIIPFYIVCCSYLLNFWSCAPLFSRSMLLQLLLYSQWYASMCSILCSCLQNSWKWWQVNITVSTDCIIVKPICGTLRTTTRWRFHVVMIKCVPSPKCT